MKQNVKVIFENLFERASQLKDCRTNIEEAFNTLHNCYANRGKVLVCGNGGSAADSEHIVGELMKGFILKRPICDKDKEKLKAVFPDDWTYLSDNLEGALPAISLVSQCSLSTAFINDVAPDMVFAQQIYGYGSEYDVLIGISTSGNSKNVVNAIKTAKAFNIKTIGMTGESGGEMKKLCDVTITVPSDITYKVQEYHLPVYHTLCAMIEAEIFEK